MKPLKQASFETREKQIVDPGAAAGCGRAAESSGFTSNCVNRGWLPSQVLARGAEFRARGPRDLSPAGTAIGTSC